MYFQNPEEKRTSVLSWKARLEGLLAFDLQLHYIALRILHVVGIRSWKSEVPHWLFLIHAKVHALFQFSFYKLHCMIRVQGSQHFDHTCRQIFTKKIENIILWSANWNQSCCNIRVGIISDNSAAKKQLLEWAETVEKGLEIWSMLQKLKMENSCSLWMTNSFIMHLFKRETCKFVSIRNFIY